MIPVSKPKLPGAEAILPYLQEIDANRWYSNFGPLAEAFNERLAKTLKVQKEHAVAVANGTLGLTVALQALEVPRGSLCVMPSWTFTATPAAALAAGLAPCFVDVESDTQALSPERVKSYLKQINGDVSAVIAVSPFGAPVDTQAWDRFTEETGIPVLIDAAAAFDSVANGAMRTGRTPVMVSLHATKTLGIGEGGVIVCRNPDTIFRVRRLINFGFESDRRSHRIAINAKISEYGAAVGMAALDEWEQTREGWARVRDAYLFRLAKEGLSLWLNRDWVTSTCNVLFPSHAIAMAERLEKAGIETRRWWLTGCHAQPAYRYCASHGELNVTQWLGQSLLGLPMAVDMREEDINTVCETVLDACAGMDMRVAS